jgi:hypothetical protein
VPEGPFPGAKARPGRDADHSRHLMPRSRKSRSYISSPPSAFVACSGIALAFTHAVSSSDYTASNDRMINGVERKWEDTVVAQFTAETVGKHENLSQNSQAPSRDLNPGSSEYKA